MFWVVNAALAGAIVKPTVAADMVMANDAAMLYVMTMKPGLTGSLLIVVLVMRAVTMTRARRWRARASYAWRV